MDFLHEQHRIIVEIEKKRNKGQFLQFLTGDAINSGDNYFYDIYSGIRSLDESLRLYYFKHVKESDRFDYFLHLVGSNKIECYKRNDCEELGCTKLANINEMFDPPNRVDVPTRKRSKSDISNTPEATADVVGQAEGVANATSAILEHLTQFIEQGNKEPGKRCLILLENLQWIANLYDQADTTWISKLQDSRWQKAKNLLVICTISDMELVKKYSFVEEESIVSLPSAEEIFLAYWRFLMRSKKIIDNYNYSLVDLDNIAHSMSTGKKNLVQCMRVLREVVDDNSTRLTVKDFEKHADQKIDEKILWDDVFLDEDIKRRINGAVDKFINSKDASESLKGMIFAGPPGTGKTMIAKALAVTKQCYFMAPTLADLKAEYVGQSSANIKRIFAEARANQPTILFIDEADTVFPARQNAGRTGDSFGLDMVNQFLQEIDGAKNGSQKIFVIAASNREEAIDSAISSRLGKPVKINLPNRDVRLRMFNKRLYPFNLEGKTYCSDVLNRSEHMSGRDIDVFIKNLKNKFELQGLDEPNEQTFLEVFADRERAIIDECVKNGVFSNVERPPVDNFRSVDDIIGYEDIKNKINEQASFIKKYNGDIVYRDRVNRLAIPQSKGILLYGPPGNGKTQLAQTIASVNGFYFIKIISQDFASIYQNEKIIRLREIFEETLKFSAITTAPGVVLFFDEFDALAGNSVLDPVVRGSLLDYLADEKGIRAKDSKVLLICATNFYNDIDNAVKRTGRLDEHFYMDNPTEQEGKFMLYKFFFDDKNVECEKELSVIAYEKLRDKIRNNKETLKKLIQKIVGNLMDFNSLDFSQKNWIEQQKKTLFPSGSDIKNLYLDLKRHAFNKNSVINGKIKITQHLIDEWFPDTEKSNGDHS